MYEVEVKVHADHEAVRARLAEVDAERIGRVEQADTYYDAPHRSFAETDEALRVRRTTRRDDGNGTAGERDGGTTAADEGADGGTTVRLTYKGPLVDEASKTREEFETAVEDGETVDAILDGLGFESAATVEKTRERYRLGDYAVTLDSVDGLGEFVEVEREADEQEVDRAREGVRETLRELGLDPDAQIRTSYLGLLLDGDDSE